MSSTVQQDQSIGEFDRSGGSRSHRAALVVGAASSSGRSLARQLVAYGLRVHCVDSRPVVVPAATCHQIPGGPGVLPALARLVRDEHIDLVIPVSSVALSLVSVGRAAFGAHVDVVVPGPGPTAVAQDRLMTAWSLRAHGVEVPHFGVPSDFVEQQGMQSFLRRALMLRMRSTDREPRSELVDNATELDWASLADDILVQEFVPGTTYLAVLYRPLDGKGRLTTLLEETILDDGSIGAAVVGGESPLPAIQRVAQAAVRALGITGPAEVSLRDREGADPVVLDVRVGFGPHSDQVPELLDAVLRDHPPKTAVVESRDRVNGAPAGGFSTRGVRAFASQVRL